MRSHTSLLAVIIISLTFLTSPTLAVDAPTKRPNILWITCEDISPHLGCYGDKYATTPNLDKLASQGVLYTHAFATSGVCAPARSCIITSVYPSTLGSQYMRCRMKLPDQIKFFTHHLRKAGYYCTNNSKQDYNLVVPPGAWDESSRKAHWRNRRKGQPFFAVFNLTISHESRIRANKRHFENLAKTFKRHDPKKATVPPYFPDTPVVRRDLARLADNITAMDDQVANILKQLKEDGLADNTIVFYYSDHGNGLPRSKRWLYDSGIHVPLIIRFPKSLQHLAPAKPGSKTNRLVSFVDFGATALSLANVKPPNHMHGRPFLGKYQTQPRKYVYGIRDRMDERYDMVRAVRNHRYKYLRNYMPHLTYAQHLAYMNQMPTMKELRRLDAAGKLPYPAGQFMQKTKPAEELYDTHNDPHEVHNLANSPKHKHILEELRKAHLQWTLRTRDLGYIPEANLAERRANLTGYEFGAAGEQTYPLKKIRNAAITATTSNTSIDTLTKLLSDKDSAVRYWACVGLAIQHKSAKPVIPLLTAALKDPTPNVRLAAAEALIKLGQTKDSIALAASELTSKNQWARLTAAIVLDHADGHATPAIPTMKKSIRTEKKNKYVVRVLTHAINELK